MAIKEKSLIIVYTDLLHKHGDPDAPEVKAFVEQHRDDADFVRRAEMLNRLQILKQDRTA